MILHIALAASLVFEIMSHLSLSSTAIYDNDSSDDYDFSVIPLAMLIIMHRCVICYFYYLSAIDHVTFI